MIADQPSEASASTRPHHVLTWIATVSQPLSRWALFLVYFWFGSLKVFATSSAHPLVANLLEHTLPFISFDQFIIALGIFEMAIGVAWLIPGRERLALLLLVPHIVMTTMLLVLLPAIAWQSTFIPTLEGQYIIKNILSVALAFNIVSQAHRPQ